MPFMRIILGALGLILAAAILWAAMRANLWASFGQIIADPWGVVTLIDLYSGFVVAAVIIWLLEPRKGLALGLIVLTPVLGNLVTLFWLAWRGAGLIRGRVPSATGARQN